jgi:cytochrome c55X
VRILALEVNCLPNPAKRGLHGPLFFGLLCCLAISLLGGMKSVAAEESMSTQRQTELVRLVRQDCGSCHGMTLAGGLGPALLPSLLREKPAESLVATILYGRPGTPMPPWGAFLNENEASWIVDKLLKGFPDER